jgi:hypothetical protein
LALDGEGIRIATYGIELQHNMVSTQYSDKYLKDQCIVHFIVCTLYPTSLMLYGSCQP